MLAGATAALRDELLMFQERLWRQDFGFALFCLMGLEENPLASAASVAVDLTGMEVWDPGQRAGRREVPCLPVLLFVPAENKPGGGES